VIDPGRHRWIVSAICGDCLTSDTGRAIRGGAVGVATINRGPVQRCILCGFPFADQQDQPPPSAPPLPEER
jgi:Zn ribbon nucleic-acid-binding protein